MDVAFSLKAEYGAEPKDVGGVAVDPLVFLHKTARECSNATLSLRYVWGQSKLGISNFLDTDIFADFHSKKLGVGGFSSLWVHLGYSSKGITYVADSYPEIPENFFNHFRKRLINDGRATYSRPTQLAGGVSFFRPYSCNIIMDVEWMLGRAELVDGMMVRRPSSRVIIEIDQPSPGIFALRDLSVADSEDSLFSMEDAKSAFAWDVFGLGDYRPYLHRLIELATQKPREEWHDFTGLAPSNQSANAIPESLDDALELFFDGEQRSGLKQRISEAALHSGMYAPIPRLNLGLKMLPAAGKLDVASVSSAAEYLIGNLDSLGVMPRREATDMIAQKVLNLVMGRFQLSIEDAKKMVEAL